MVILNRKFIWLVLRRFFMWGTPLALGILFVEHPIRLESGGITLALEGGATWWTTMHLLEIPLLALLALSVYMLLPEISSLAARITQAALVIFVAFYAAWEAVTGVAIGELVQFVLNLSESKRAIVEPAIDLLWTSPLFGHLSLVGWVIGSLAWLTALVATAAACHVAGNPKRPVVFLVLSGLFLGVTHFPPIGPFAMFFLLIASVEIELRKPALAVNHHEEALRTQ